MGASVTKEDPALARNAGIRQSVLVIGLSFVAALSCLVRTVVGVATSLAPLTRLPRLSVRRSSLAFFVSFQPAVQRSPSGRRPSRVLRSPTRRSFARAGPRITLRRCVLCCCARLAHCARPERGVHVRMEAGQHGRAHLAGLHHAGRCGGGLGQERLVAHGCGGSGAGCTQPHHRADRRIIYLLLVTAVFLCGGGWLTLCAWDGNDVRESNDWCQQTSARSCSYGSFIGLVIVEVVVWLALWAFGLLYAVWAWKADYRRPVGLCSGRAPAISVPRMGRGPDSAVAASTVALAPTPQPAASVRVDSSNPFGSPSSNPFDDDENPF